MSVSRRKFMKVGIIAGFSALIPATSIIAFGQKLPSGASPTDPLSRLQQEDFARYLYTSFTIRLSKTSTLKAELYQVQENKPGEVQGLDNFSLVFRGLHANGLRQNTYQFEHPQLGTFNLFIVPAGSQGNLKFYRAVFNRV